MTIAELIRRRLEELGKPRTHLRAELQRVGVTVSRQTVHDWCTDRGRPSPANVLALWTVLVVPTSERDQWMEALALPRVGESAATA